MSQNLTANSVLSIVFFLLQSKDDNCVVKTKNDGLMILPSFAWNARAKMNATAVNSRGRNE